MNNPDRQKSHPWYNKPRMEAQGVIQCSSLNSAPNNPPEPDDRSWAQRLVEGEGFEPDNE